MCRPDWLVRLPVSLQQWSAMASTSFTTLHNRLAKCLRPSICQALEADKRRQEQKVRGQRTRLCALYLDRQEQLGSDNEICRSASLSAASCALPT
jgi:hypothetical protein